MDLLSTCENKQATRGLTYVHDYLTVSQAQDILQIIDAAEWSQALKRRVQHYGYRYDYKARGVDASAKIGVIPQWLHPLCQRLQEEGFFEQIPDQVIINEYQAGQGIAPHIDCVPCFGATIASLSLLSNCVMDFVHSKTQEKYSMLLDSCSLLVLSSDARYLWQHGIAQRKSDRWEGVVIKRERRISLTFRTVTLS